MSDKKTLLSNAPSIQFLTNRTIGNRFSEFGTLIGSIACTFSTFSSKFSEIRNSSLKIILRTINKTERSIIRQCLKPPNFHDTLPIIEYARSPVLIFWSLLNALNGKKYATPFSHAGFAMSYRTTRTHGK